MKYINLTLVSLSLCFFSCGSNFDKRSVEKKILPVAQSKPTIEVNKDTLMGKNFFYVDKTNFLYQVELKADGVGTLITDIGTSVITYTVSADFRTYTLIPKSKLKSDRKTLKKVVIEIKNSLKLTKVWETLETEDQIPKLNNQDETDVKYTPRFESAHDIAAGDTIVLPIKNNQSVILVKMTDESNGVVLDKGGQALGDKLTWSLSENKNQLDIQWDKGLKISYVKMGDNKYSFVAILDGKSIQIARSLKIANTPTLTEKNVIGQYSISGGNPGNSLIFDEDGVGGRSSHGADGKDTVKLWAWSLSEKRDAILTKDYVNEDDESPASKEELLKCVNGKAKCTVTQERSYRILQQDKQNFLFLKTVKMSDGTVSSTMEELTQK